MGQSYGWKQFNGSKSSRVRKYCFPKRALGHILDPTWIANHAILNQIAQSLINLLIPFLNPHPIFINLLLSKPTLSLLFLYPQILYLPLIPHFLLNLIILVQFLMKVLLLGWRQRGVTVDLEWVLLFVEGIDVDFFCLLEFLAFLVEVIGTVGLGLGDGKGFLGLGFLTRLLFWFLFCLAIGSVYVLYSLLLLCFLFYFPSLIDILAFGFFSALFPLLLFLFLFLFDHLFLFHSLTDMAFSLASSRSLSTLPMLAITIVLTWIILFILLCLNRLRIPVYFLRTMPQLIILLTVHFLFLSFLLLDNLSSDLHLHFDPLKLFKLIFVIIHGNCILFGQLFPDHSQNRPLIFQINAVKSQKFLYFLMQLRAFFHLQNISIFTDADIYFELNTFPRVNFLHLGCHRILCIRWIQRQII